MILIYWALGVIITYLILYWMNIKFNVNSDEKGTRILVSFLWPVFAITEIADIIVKLKDHYVTEINKKIPDTAFHKLTKKLGEVFNKLF